MYDPTDPVGRLLFNVLAMVAEFEADLARTRTREGMAVAKAKGRLRGKQPKLNSKQEAHLVDLWRAGEHTTLDLAERSRRPSRAPNGGAGAHPCLVGHSRDALVRNAGGRAASSAPRPATRVWCAGRPAVRDPRPRSTGRSGGPQIPMVSFPLFRGGVPHTRV